MSLLLLGSGLAAVARGQLGNIAAGPDGNLWFTESSTFGGKIGRITTAGVITEFSMPAAFSNPTGIAAGPDGNLWFTESNANKIGWITIAGDITEFCLPAFGFFGSSSGPSGIAAGPDGNLWFTETNANQIGRITTEGVLTEFSIPTARGFPRDITAGPDGNLWFTERGCSLPGLCPGGNRIGRITTAGVITEFPIPTARSFPQGIAAGPDGNLWFTESAYNANKIGRITTAGVITEFSISTTNSAPLSITAGTDGNLWFAESSGYQIGRITTAGHITEFAVRPIHEDISALPIGIASGPDGNLWFTENYEPKIGRITTAGVVTEFSFPATVTCFANETTLCLNEGRFSVRVSWSVPSQALGGDGVPSQLTDNTGAFWFLTDTNLELVIKVLDGRSINGHFWVFYGALSNVRYTITVTDTKTGLVRTYDNADGNLASVADTNAFQDSAMTAGGVEVAQEAASGRKTQTRSAAELYGMYAALTQARAEPAAEAAPCPIGTTILYLGGSFQVSVDWAVPSRGLSGHGTAVQVVPDTGYFWFFSNANADLAVKVLDGQAINGHFWVFYGALTNVEYTITVTNTTTGVVHTYTNPDGKLASFADTRAFLPAP